MENATVERQGKLSHSWLAYVCCVLFLMFPVFSTSAADFPSVRFEHLLSKHGVTLGPVDSLLQDSRGFIWLGGQNGLVRYDGYTFTLYRNQYDDPHSLSNNAIWDMAEDQQGGLWIATEGGLNYYDRRQDHFVRYMHNSTEKNSIATNELRSVLVARNGDIWVGTYGRGVSRLHVEDQTFSHYRHEPGNAASLSDDVVWSLFQDGEATIWVGTENGGVNRFHEKVETFTSYQADPSIANSISHNTVRAITEDSLGAIWLGTDKGLNRFDKYREIFEHYRYSATDPNSLGGDIIWDVFEDKNGLLWIGTDGGGLSIFDAEEKRFHRYTFDKNNPFSISSNVVRTILEDRNGDIWTGNFPMGANVFYRTAEKVSLIQFAPNQSNGLNHSSVLSLLEGDDGLWIGTDGGGVNFLDEESQTFKHYVQSDAPGSLSSNAVLSMARDKLGRLWVGTWGGSIHRFEQDSQRFISYPSDSSDIHTPAQQNIWSIYSDSQGELWIGTEGGGLNRYDFDNDRFIRYPFGQLTENALAGEIVWVIFEDSQSYLWVGTNKGLSRYDRHKNQFKHFSFNTTKGHLSNANVLSLYESAEGVLWVGTRSGLNRYDPETDTFSVVRETDGLASDLVSSILEDDDGRLWLGTANGLSRYHPSTGEIRNYDQSQWGHGKYNDNAAIVTSDGRMLFGGVNGITVFKPHEIYSNTTVPPVAIVDFQIFNRTQIPGISGSPLSHSIFTTDHITLTYKQSVFSFEFTALNYQNPDKNTYAYKLKGFDKDWNQVGTQRRATYTNLDAGEYVFQVIGSNNEGLWNQEGQKITITILPPPWKTWWAYTLYAVFLLSIILSYMLSQKRKIERERAINQRLRYLDKLKDDFLANTSHELRTPLNGIIGLSDSLVDGAAGELNEILKSNLLMISGSGKRLANLVNDILDFSKLKSNQITLNLQPVDVKKIIDVVVTMSLPLVSKKPVLLRSIIDDGLPAVMADESRIQQILYNLVGNAAKFTKEGEIIVSTEINGGKLWILVKDTGIGIVKDHQQKIFESFEQIEDHENRQYSGTGLGLSVTKQLVELHHGEIVVESELGVGSTFKFSLDITFESVVSSSFGSVEEQESSKLYDDDLSGKTIQAKNDEAPSFSDRKTETKLSVIRNEMQFDGSVDRIFNILIVDDEMVNRQVLRNQLGLDPAYRAFEAENGQEALHMINEAEEPFDLVLLDIMMPGMSGYEVCSRLRVRYSMHELPIIFLTAKNLISDLVDGFEVGANDFLTKPISKGELKSRVRTHLQLLDINHNLDTKVKTRTQEVEKANQVLETLDGIVASINQEVIMDRLLEVLLREAVSLFPAVDRTLYWHLNDDDQRFYCLGVEGCEATEYETLSIEASKLTDRYVSGSVELSEGIYLVKPDIKSACYEEFSKLPKARSLIAFKLLFEDSLEGFLVLVSDSDMDAFEGGDLKTLVRFSAHSKSALSKVRLMEMLQQKNEILEDVSLTDYLTNLRNRRYLLKYLDSDIALTLRQYQYDEETHEAAPNSDLLFFMVDLDYFKSVNDEYGHAAGDQVLVQIKEIMEKVFRTSDFLIRWGGEEFLIVARFCNREAAPLMAERLRVAFENHDFDLGNGMSIKRTCSIGFACFPFIPAAPKEFSWMQVVDIADHCLYLAKTHQRNAWVGLTEPSPDMKANEIRQILNDTQSLISAGDLEVVASFDTAPPLNWKKK